jgi:pyruvate ferredoxin oxidoreductase alpha subunit
MHKRGYLNGTGGEVIRMKMIVRGNEATAVGAKLSRPDVIPAYPITPSTLFPERISEYVADGELDTQFLTMESEHSAISACIGASATGARTCTCTASQGLALMHEMLFIAAGMRLPIVMPIGNRALSAPINIWCDHQDTISELDTGWMQFYAEKNQEAMDLVIMAFKIAENKDVLLPAMVGLDAFVLTHTMGVVDVPEQSEVDEFLPPFTTSANYLDPSNPATIGSFGTPDYYMEFKYAEELAMKEASRVIDEVFAEFKEKFGREYNKIDTYETEDVDIVLITLGSMSGTARAAVKQMRKEGKKVGLAKLTVLRPFPEGELLECAKDTKVLAVVDRNISFGYGGRVYSEVAGKLVNQPTKPLITNYVVGLGGRDVTIKDFREIVSDCETVIKTGKVETQTKWINVKEENL